jgi:hydroxyacylglutathione hydrolase
MSLKAAIIPVTPFAQNCSLLWCDETMTGAVVDPGGDLELIRRAISQYGVHIVKVLLTHDGHAQFAKELGVPIEGPQEEEAFWLDKLPEQGQNWGFPGAEAVTPDRWLKDGDQVSIGNVTLDVIHCPGHTPGHVVYFCPQSRLAVVGDVLFQGSIGRTDFPRGDHDTLIHSITQKLWPLGDDVTFIPGHGPLSTFGAERQSNPFVGDRALKSHDA